MDLPSARAVRLEGKGRRGQGWGVIRVSFLIPQSSVLSPPPYSFARLAATAIAVQFSDRIFAKKCPQKKNQRAMVYRTETVLLLDSLTGT